MGGRGQENNLPDSVTLLSIKDVSVFYGKVQALDSVSLDIATGSITTLIGANGAGKTSLLMSICGDPRAKKGSICFNGKAITRLDTALIMREGIAVVPEGRRIFSRLTVEENLNMGGFFTGSDQFSKNLEWVMALFPRLRERFNQRGGTLSGGEQQMLAIARALMGNPTLLLLDEPSLGLAPMVIQQIFEIVSQLRSQGVTVFLVEQNANLALKITDQGYVLENGRIILGDTGSALLVNKEVRSAYLGE